MSFFNKVLSRLLPYRGTVYRRIGGARGIGHLVDEFYLVMRTDENARDCLLAHEGRDISVSAEKLKAFLSGWLGGPQLYLKKYGHPRMRMRHLLFSIGETEAKQWLYCMGIALKRCGVPEEEAIEMMRAFQGMTELIKNCSSSYP